MPDDHAGNSTVARLPSAEGRLPFTLRERELPTFPASTVCACVKPDAGRRQRPTELLLDLLRDRKIEAQLADEIENIYSDTAWKS